MIEYLEQNEGLITHQLIFKDKKISEKTYKQLEKRIKKYKDTLALTHIPDGDEVIIIVNKKCENDKCRKNEAEKFIEYYSSILNKI